jgi:DNA invertase Pin-like site-specific DNA recombinase
MERMKYGYARVSTEDQNAAMQHTALKRAGCKTLFTDELSGANRQHPALLRCMKKLERGDILHELFRVLAVGGGHLVEPRFNVR